METAGYKVASAKRICKISKKLGSQSSNKGSFIMILLSPSIIFLLTIGSMEMSTGVISSFYGFPSMASGIRKIQLERKILPGDVHSDYLCTH